MSSLPNELVAVVLDELDRDYLSLKTCALVTTAFCSTSQRHLFRSIWLHRGDWHSYTFAQQAVHRGVSIPSGTIMGWHSLISTSPHLASHVRDLTIDLPSSEDEDITLKHVLRALPSIERLVISGMAVRWGDLSAGLRSVVLAMLSLPSLDRLHLLDIRDVPTQILRVLPSMKAFSIHRTTFKGDTDPPESEGLPSSRLEHITISTNMRSTYKLILPHAPRFTNVTKIHLFIDFFSCMGPEKLLSAVGRTLQHLELDCDRLYYPFGLPPLPSLRTLELRVSNGSKRSMPDGLAGTLAGLPRVPLKIVFKVSDRTVEPAWEDEGTFPGIADWRLDDVHCRLLFQDAADPAVPPMRDAAFSAFRVAIGTAMPGVHVTFSRAEEHESYVGLLP
ncbi:hypothetical protein DFH07DRAFT_252759 [Mycena maculata]|uniref:F-box domain-containing protein n=1 Tax=Mycena maculata TaxID=230809 RepID=A0AAD7HPL9_9AGAR|nr:hypothetical protein DFH07DRAFT_252759 [Mycena maculata]